MQFIAVTSHIWKDTASEVSDENANRYSWETAQNASYKVRQLSLKDFITTKSTDVSALSH